MSEVVSESVNSLPRDTPFDDRIDTETRIGNLEVLRLLARSLRLFGSVKKLFTAKLGLAALALIPGFYAPWLPKIITNQVLQQQSFDESKIPFPPYMMPFLDAIGSLAPMEIMAAIVAVYVVGLFLFGRAGVWVSFAQGEDSATQSENALSGGWSQANGVVGVCDALAQTRLSQMLTNNLRTDLFRRMARLPMTTLDDHRIGDAVYRVMYDAPMVPGMCYAVTLEPLFLIIGAVISLYLMNYSYGSVAPELIWIALAMIPIGLLFTVPFSGLARRVSQDSRAAGSATTNAIEESFSNIAAVQSLGGISREKERIEGQSAESYRRFRHIKIVRIVIDFAGLLVLFCGLIYVAVLIKNYIIDDVMSIGDFWVLFNLFFTLAGSALKIGTFWIEMQGSAAAVRRVFFFIDLPSEDPGTSLPDVGNVTRDIRIEGVDFSYPDGRAALKDISLDFKLNELVAVVGPTGAGKTSLAYLIPGFLRPTRGRVLFDGKDLTQVNVDSVRDQVTYVFQEHLLLSESIRENLLLVNPHATEAELRAALETAGALVFVEALPDGIDTILGRSGDTLSVGQKQRLCIARGLIRDTKILILDEPTAALDPQTENALVRGLQQAAKNRLVIVIAHRLSTIRKADRIIFLDDGEIRDIGSHESLMADPDSPYRRFVELQGG